jgi:hypothetical protein
MPQGLIRYEHTGNFHFLTFSCYHRVPHLRTAAARDLFEDALESKNSTHLNLGAPGTSLLGTRESTHSTNQRLSS